MEAFNGGLFASDFLKDSIVELDEWQALDDTALDGVERSLREICDRFPVAQTPNEAQTEDDLIWPVLAHLGWTSSLRQQNLTPRGVDDVPDGLLFADEAAKTRANGFAEEWKRYEFGLAIVESKRWTLSLDGRSDRQARTAPSTQMLRYLRRVDDLTTGRLRWGILTNGARWRLYYQGARSVSEEFCEIDLAAVLDVPGHNEGLFALGAADRRHWLKVFALLFRRDAFLPTATDRRTFHRRALEEGRYYEQRVATDLSNLVFDRIFPELVRAIAAAAPDTPLPDVRDATLTLLYRLLFILYAEDRELLPVRDARYDDYGLRMRVRDDVRARKDRKDVFSATATRYWSAVDDLATAIDRGDASIGLPPYDGGLFDRERTPLLGNVRLGDQVMADVIDALSFEQAAGGRRYINYRDLSVQQLGSIYERLLERELVRDGEMIVLRPNVFARKGSGSYFTPHDLVNLILAETVEPLVQARLDEFTRAAQELADRRLTTQDRIATLERLDPAEQILELRICDPAMGSGHFLVGLVDYLAGCWARDAFDTANRLGSPLFLHEPLNRATRAAMSMQTIEEPTDAEIAQADQSSGLYDEILEMTAPLDAFLSLVHAFEWLDVRDTNGQTALGHYFQSAFGDPVRIATGEVEVARDSPIHERFAQLLDEARRRAADERFFNWQPAFPSVWTDWDVAEWRGGFDAVIGNPPGQDGSGFRPSRGQHRRESGEPASPGAA